MGQKARDQAPNHIRLLLVDDHHVVRVGLATVFEMFPQFQVVAQASTASEAIAETMRCKPDVVVMDVRLSEGDGIEACREIRSRFPNTQVLVLTSYNDEEALIASIMAGAAGYLLKRSDPEGLVEAVERVARGGSLLDPAVTRSVLDFMRSANHADGALSALTAQERRVLGYLADGSTNQEIAEQLRLSRHTVKAHVSNILQKLNLARRGQVAPYLAARQSAMSPFGGSGQPQLH